ncbi:MAG TPA: POTRA domain-containing protein, partial [Bacteroidota bacterium]
MKPGHRWGSRLLRGPIGLCALGTLLAALSVRAAEPPELKVRSVKFEGTHAYADSRLYDLMVNRPPTFWHSSKFQPAVLNDDLTNIVNFYDAEGFLQAKVLSHSVKVDSADAKVDIEIALAEGAQTKVDHFGVDGNKVFPDSVLLDRIDLKPGDPFRRQQVIDGMLNILSVYADSGYLNTRLLPDFQVDSGAHLASTVLHVQEGPRSYVGAIRIEGLSRTDEAVIRRELLFHPGEVIHYSDLLESQQHLYMTN